MAIISESTFKDLTLLESVEIVEDLSSIGRSNECAFELPVFAYPSDTSDLYRNDFTSILVSLNNRYTDKKIFLEVETSCDNWTEVAQLNDSTYGLFAANFASKPDWIGYRLDWYKVYNLEGVGCYRFRTEYDNIITATTEIKYSYKYNLKLFNANLADKTTKIYYKIEGGKLGRINNDKEVIDYKDVIWDREVRLPNSFFGFESSEFSREYTRYKSGAQVEIENSQIESLLFNVKKLPYSLHRELKVVALMCDDIRISDYNSSNLTTYDAKRVVCTSSYEPNWNLYNSYASVELTFKPYYENLRRKRC